MNIKDFYDNKQALDNSLKPFYCKSVVEFYSKLPDLDKTISNWVYSNIVEFMEALKAKGVNVDETAEIIENEELVPQLDGYTDDDTYIQFKFNILHNNTKYESKITLYISGW